MRKQSLARTIRRSRCLTLPCGPLVPPSDLEAPSDLVSGDETEVHQNAISTSGSVLNPNRASIDDREGSVFAIESVCVSPESHRRIRSVQIRYCSVS
jgi:hypothetical protein